VFHHFVGVAEDAEECFSEATALRLQQEHTSTLTLEKSDFANENRVLPSSVSTSLENFSPKQVKHLHANKTSEVPVYSHGRATALHAQNNTISNVMQYDTPSPIATQVSGNYLIIHSARFPGNVKFKGLNIVSSRLNHVQH
jgi:anaphase-promoting complex subunit 3